MLIRVSFPERPAFGTAVSEALLRRVAAGDLDATLRLHHPARELAFSKQDAAAEGFGRAVEAARAAGFEPVVRLAGGRAAAFHEGTLALAWSRPDPRPAAGTRDRFEELAAIVAAALARLRVDARIGEVPGEYCPGAWSVNARGRVKLAGIGQRLTSSGAHLGCVVVASGSALLRSALEPVYAALGLDWDPATAASVEDEAEGAGVDAVEDALLAELSERYELVPAELDPETLALAEELEAAHEPRL
jgi:octanoyl-[GcvH]:protein N-octanoyltransferase